MTDEARDALAAALSDVAEHPHPAHVRRCWLCASLDNLIALARSDERQRIYSTLFESVDDWAVGGVWGDYGEVVFKSGDVAEVILQKPTDMEYRLGSEYAATMRDLRLITEDALRAIEQEAPARALDEVLSVENVARALDTVNAANVRIIDSRDYAAALLAALATDEAVP